jgi:hypothetical protein
MAAGSIMPASAVGGYVGPHGVFIVHRHHHYQDSYDDGGYTYNGCRPGWTVQGGIVRRIRDQLDRVGAGIADD